MHFPHEVTRSEEIQQGDKIEVTYTEGSVFIGSVKREILRNQEHANGHKYDVVYINLGSRVMPLHLDKNMRGMGFSIRILARPRTYKTGDFIATPIGSEASILDMPEGVIAVYACKRDGSLTGHHGGFYILKGIDD